MFPRQHIDRVHTVRRTRQGEEPEGISEDLEKTLKSKVKGQNTKQRWEEIYRILFPDEGWIPTPCRRTNSVPLSMMISLIF